MSTRGWLHFGGHQGHIWTYDGKHYGECKIFDIGETDAVGILTGRGDRQVHPLVWKDARVKKALEQNQLRRSRNNSRPKLDPEKRPRPTLATKRPRPHL